MAQSDFSGIPIPGPESVKRSVPDFMNSLRGPPVKRFIRKVIKTLPDHQVDTKFGPHHCMLTIGNLIICFQPYCSREDSCVLIRINEVPQLKLDGENALHYMKRIFTIVINLVKKNEPKYQIELYTLQKETLAEFLLSIPPFVSAEWNYADGGKISVVVQHDGWNSVAIITNGNINTKASLTAQRMDPALLHQLDMVIAPDIHNYRDYEMIMTLHAKPNGYVGYTSYLIYPQDRRVISLSTPVLASKFCLKTAQKESVKKFIKGGSEFGSEFGSELGPEAPLMIIKTHGTPFDGVIGERIDIRGDMADTRGDMAYTRGDTIDIRFGSEKLTVPTNLTDTLQNIFDEVFRFPAPEMSIRRF